jgi:hypothetical protein
MDVSHGACVLRGLKVITCCVAVGVWRVRHLLICVITAGWSSRVARVCCRRSIGHLLVCWSTVGCIRRVDRDGTSAVLQDDLGIVSIALLTPGGVAGTDHACEAFLSGGVIHLVERRLRLLSCVRWIRGGRALSVTAKEKDVSSVVKNKRRGVDGWW